MPPSPDMDAERQAVLNQIREGFRDARLEGGITLHEAEVIDDYGNAEDREDARRKDPETTWEEVPDEKIERLQVFPFLDEKGYRFYLPAYLRSEERRVGKECRWRWSRDG